MSEKPSYLTSTFSAVTLLLTIGFIILCVWIKDIVAMKEVVLLVLGGYSVKKGIEVQNGRPHEPTPSVVPPSTP